MSQRTESLFDYKNRFIGEFYMLADGGLAFDFNYGANNLLLSKETTDRILKLLIDDRKERAEYRPHVGSFVGDL